MLELLLNRGADGAEADASGRTALHRAARAGHADAAGLLFWWAVHAAPGGAGPGRAGEWRDAAGYTALHLACAHGFADVAERLLTEGADFAALAPGGRACADLAGSLCVGMEVHF
jgi:ankyrin repeat protein